MPGSQILTIVIMVATVLIGSIFNNRRIGDMGKRIDDMRDFLGAEMAKNHNQMLHRFADLDSRLTRIEERFMR